MRASTRRWVLFSTACGALLVAGLFVVPPGPGSPPHRPSAGGPEIQGWTRGQGWGWVWGKDDEVGSLNAMTDQSRAAALSLAKKGEVFDLGLSYSRNSFKWYGHSPGE